MNGFIQHREEQHHRQPLRSSHHCRQPRTAPHRGDPRSPQGATLARQGAHLAAQRQRPPGLSDPRRGCPALPARPRYPAPPARPLLPGPAVRPLLPGPVAEGRSGRGSPGRGAGPASPANRVTNTIKCPVRSLCLAENNHSDYRETFQHSPLFPRLILVGMTLIKLTYSTIFDKIHTA